MTIQEAGMHRLSVAQAKAQLSALLDAVEQGETVEITRRAVSVARLVPVPREAGQSFDLSAFCATTTRQPLYTGAVAADVVQELREDARFWNPAVEREEAWQGFQELRSSSTLSGRGTSAWQCHNGYVKSLRFAVPESDQTLEAIRIAAQRLPLRRRIIRSVATSSAIETGRTVASIELQLSTQTQKSVTWHQVTLA